MYQFSLTWFQRTFHSCILDRDISRRMSLTNLAHDVEAVQRQYRQQRRSSVLSNSLQSPRHSISEESIYEAVQTSSAKLRRITRQFTPTINPQQRAATLRTLVDRLTYTIYQLVSWSVFAEHQLLFSFLLTTTIEREEDHDRRNSHNTIIPDIIQEEQTETTGHD
jgi:dynein heavy chain